MAIFLGAIKLSDINEGDIFINKKDGNKIKFLYSKNYFAGDDRKKIRYVYYRVLNGYQANYLKHTTLIKFKKEFNKI